MKHPTQEDWMSYLYDELPPEQHREHTAHLGSCAECRKQVDGWRGTLQQLDAWKVEAVTTAPPVARPAIWKWAAAAAVLLGLGFGFGRLAAPSVDVATLRQEIEKSVTASVNTQWQRQLVAVQDTLKTARETDRTQLVEILKQMETTRTADYQQLRQDLETVAVVAENKLLATEQQIGQLVANNH